MSHRNRRSPAPHSHGRSPRRSRMWRFAVPAAAVAMLATLPMLGLSGAIVPVEAASA